MTSFASSQPAPQLQALRKIKDFLRLEFLLRFSMRMAIITALFSSISFQLIPATRRADFLKGFVITSGGPYGIGDASLIVWLTLGAAFFIPYSLLIDLIMYIWIAYRTFCFLPGDMRHISKWSILNPPELYMAMLSSIIESAVVLFIGFLRVLGFGLALVEIHLCAPTTSYTLRKKSYFDLVVKPHYDWWTFKPLPKEFTMRPWKRRICRPWLPHTSHSYSPTAPTQRQNTGTETITPYVSIFFGTQTFRTRRGEMLWFVVVRGLVAAACLAILVVYSANALFLQPTNESWSPPIQIQRISTSNIKTKVPAPLWGVIVGINTRYVPLPSGTDLGNLVSVTANRGIAPRTPCSSTNIPAISDTTWRAYRLVIYRCATLGAEGLRASTPQIHIHADYARLNIFRSNFTPEGSIMIWPSFTENFHSVLASTKPTSLVIGNSVIARVNSIVRVIFAAPTRATLGFTSSREMQMIGKVTVSGMDPSPLGIDAVRPEGFASVRLLKAVHTQDWELHSDVRQSTILVGLSALGGLSVFLNTVFIALFGGSLTLILFDVKPLSVFGLLHYFSKSTLLQHFGQHFPQLGEEGGQPGYHTSGLVAFIREYMLDFGPLHPGAKHANLEPKSQEPDQICVQ